MSDEIGEAYRAAPAGQEPGEIWFGVFQGARMVSARVMTQDEAEAEAARLNLAARGLDIEDPGTLKPRGSGG
ncbi:hypothetical protein [Acidisoma sp. C75]